MKQMITIVSNIWVSLPATIKVTFNILIHLVFTILYEVGSIISIANL